MSSTVLDGLDDADIPEEFNEELQRATLLAALLREGWVPPSRAHRRLTRMADVIGAYDAARIDAEDKQRREDARRAASRRQQ